MYDEITHLSVIWTQICTKSEQSIKCYLQQLLADSYTMCFMGRYEVISFSEEFNGYVKVFSFLSLTTMKENEEDSPSR